METLPIRVLIVDDHPFVLRGLTATIDPEPDMKVVASAATGKEALDRFREAQPDITVMDLNLTPDMTGLQAIQAIKREAPQARIIVLSAYKGDEDIYRCLEAGAATYLFKDALSENLISIIRQVHAGGGPIPPEVGRKLADRVTMASLTPREIEVLRLVAKGMRDKEISARLYISEDTVQEHVKNIRTKLKVHDRVEAVTVAVRRGFLRID